MHTLVHGDDDGTDESAGEKCVGEDFDDSSVVFTSTQLRTATTCKETCPCGNNLPLFLLFT